MPQTLGKPDFIMATYIKCTQNALRNADAVANHDFLGQTAERRGDTIVRLTPDGMETLHAHEVEVAPMTRLVTTFEPKWEPDAETSTVVYLIAPEGDHCKQTVEHHGLRHDPDGGTLAGLKTWLETGTPTQFGGAHFRDKHDTDTNQTENT